MSLLVISCGGYHTSSGLHQNIERSSFLSHQTLVSPPIIFDNRRNEHTRTRAGIFASTDKAVQRGHLPPYNNLDSTCAYPIRIALFGGAA